MDSASLAALLAATIREAGLAKTTDLSFLASKEDIGILSGEVSAHDERLTDQDNRIDNRRVHPRPMSGRSAWPWRPWTSRPRSTSLITRWQLRRSSAAACRLLSSMRGCVKRSARAPAQPSQAWSFRRSHCSVADARAPRKNADVVEPLAGVGVGAPAAPLARRALSSPME